MELYLSREEFRAFLAANPEKVFRAVEACNCPLAGFLNREVPDGDIFNRYSVTRNHIRLREQCWDTPEWAHDFIKKVDYPSGPGKLITGAEALKILDSVAA